MYFEILFSYVLFRYRIRLIFFFFFFFIQNFTPKIIYLQHFTPKYNFIYVCNSFLKHICIPKNYFLNFILFFIQNLVPKIFFVQKFTPKNYFCSKFSSEILFLYILCSFYFVFEKHVYSENLFLTFYFVIHRI